MSVKKKLSAEIEVHSNTQTLRILRISLEPLFPSFTPYFTLVLTSDAHQHLIRLTLFTSIHLRHWSILIPPCQITATNKDGESGNSGFYNSNIQYSNEILLLISPASYKMFPCIIISVLIYMHRLANSQHIFPLCSDALHTDAVQC